VSMVIEFLDHARQNLDPVFIWARRKKKIPINYVTPRIKQLTYSVTYQWF
jgi:hypothetical protein